MNKGGLRRALRTPSCAIDGGTAEETAQHLRAAEVLARRSMTLEQAPEPVRMIRSKARGWSVLAAAALWGK